MREFFGGAVTGLHVLTMSLVVVATANMLMDGELSYVVGVVAGVAFSHAFYRFFLGDE
jgi:hypothetical protein